MGIKEGGIDQTRLRIVRTRIDNCEPKKCQVSLVHVRGKIRNNKGIFLLHNINFKKQGVTQTCQNIPKSD